MTSGDALERHRLDFFRRWPVGRMLDAALAGRSNPTPLFYFAESTDPDLKRCSWAIARLGPDLEKQFGIPGEIVVLFSPYPDFQRRTYNAVTSRLRPEVAQQQSDTKGLVRFSPDPSVAFVHAPDPRVGEKVEAWNMEGTGSMVVALPSKPNNPTQLRNQLIASLTGALSRRDLYQGRNPVTGNNFFGREETLRDLKAGFADGHSVGLFGLRRSGKTSVIQEFKRRNAQQQYAVVISDLEATASLDELPLLISDDLSATLRTLKVTDSSVWVGPVTEQSTEGFSKLGSRIQKVAEKNSRYTFVFAFDEIESLVPLVEADAMTVRTFLGTIRRSAQASPNVCLLMTGVTSRFFRDSMLDSPQSIENPMLGFVDEYFLGPFNEYETGNLIRKLGRGMMLAWDDDAVREIMQATGGFPFLVRDLASTARQLVLEQKRESAANDEISIGPELVLTAFHTWRDAAAELWAQIVNTLELHHEVMAEMVRCNTNSDLAEWLELGDESDRAARSLQGLGLLDRDDSGWQLSECLRALQRLSKQASVDIVDLRESRRDRQSQEADIQRIVGQEEGDELEFKASARVNLHTGAVDTRITHEIIRSVAGFLNAKGGALIVGVTDDRMIVGLTKDIYASKKSRDQFLLFLNNALCQAIDRSVIAGFVEVVLMEASDATICKISVEPHPGGVWCEHDNTDVFYARNGNQTVKLRNREVSEYLGNRVLKGA